MKSNGDPNLSPRSAARARVVAVTGSSSFLGQNIVGLLEEDRKVERVVSLDIQPPSTAKAKTRVYHVDLTLPQAEQRIADTFASEGVDTVVHTAFLGSPTYSSSWAHELESVGTMHLLNACRRTQVRKIVMWSLTWLYGAEPTNPNFLSEKHALRARRSERFFADKMDAEADVLRFGKPGQGRVATVLRTAPILGPTIQNFVTRYLSHRLVPAVLGFDPLWQLVHEADAVTAFKLAIDRDFPGIYNIVGDGVLPLSTVIKLAGKTRVPVPRLSADALVGACWVAQMAEAPPAFIDYLQYLCVADGEQARKVMAFSPMYTTREALLDFANAQHLREARLLTEAPA